MCLEAHAGLGHQDQRRHLHLDEVGGGTKVTYNLKVDVSIPMLGMMKRKAEKAIVDTALKGLKKRVEQG